MGKVAESRCVQAGEPAAKHRPGDCSQDYRTVDGRILTTIRRASRGTPVGGPDSAQSANLKQRPNRSPPALTCLQPHNVYPPFVSTAAGALRGPAAPAHSRARVRRRRENRRTAMAMLCGSSISRMRDGRVRAERLRRLPGVIEAEASAAGSIRAKFDRSVTSEAASM